MSLDSDLEAFLELAELGRLTGKSQPMHALSVAQARAEFAKTSRLLDPDPPAHVEVSELLFATRDGAQLPARLYRRPGITPKATLVYLHGGGYVVGSLDSHDCVCRRLACLGDYAVFAPEYRLAPEQPFPTALHDCQDAAQWLHDNADALQLQATDLVLAGDSAGATLATVMAITAAGQAQGMPVKAQLLFYPVAHSTTHRDSHQRYAEGYLLETATLDWFYAHYLGSTQAQNDWRASPLLHPALPTMAPAYVNLAQYDPLFDEGLAYAGKLEASGTPTTLRIEAGLTHDFLRMSGITGASGEVYAAAGRWLEGVLAR
ncbi:alpha/beta hydrolase [Pseudomonas sp.]|uniref:alpha/beta hydrolase n=1 Tax=Pseudomonas sp. TaxID=306 RepID=UPI0028B203D4|nr:alpha/beta hydrolase [Pseudomonas sp.]